MKISYLHKVLLLGGITKFKITSFERHRHGGISDIGGYRRINGSISKHHHQFHPLPSFCSLLVITECLDDRYVYPISLIALWRHQESWEHSSLALCKPIIPTSLYHLVSLELINILLDILGLRLSNTGRNQVWDHVRHKCWSNNVEKQKGIKSSSLFSCLHKSIWHHMEHTRRALRHPVITEREKNECNRCT